MLKNFKINSLLNQVHLKKQYINKLKNKVSILNNIESYKKLNFLLPKKYSLSSSEYLITYIIDISFFKSNTLMHVMDSSGKLIFYCSAGTFKYKGKSKKSRRLILKRMYNTLIDKLEFLRKKPVALHLKNVSFNKFWIIKKLKNKFFIKVVKVFDTYPYNGCRKKKVRRKKFRTKSFKKKKWLSGLKRQIVNLLSCLIVGSNPTFFMIIKVKK